MTEHSQIHTRNKSSLFCLPEKYEHMKIGEFDSYIIMKMSEHRTNGSHLSHTADF